jgi:hypothetical protein
MMMHRIAFASALVAALSGCGTSTPPADMPLRDAKFYEANPAEIPPMQNICDQWKASKVPVAAFPAVVVSNCNAVLEAKQFAKRQAALRSYRGGK